MKSWLTIGLQQDFVIIVSKLCALGTLELQTIITLCWHELLHSCQLMCFNCTCNCKGVATKINKVHYEWMEINVNMTIQQ
jgi:hypothetical protein